MTIYILPIVFPRMTLSDARSTLTKMAEPEGSASVG